MFKNFPQASRGTLTGKGRMPGKREQKECSPAVMTALQNGLYTIVAAGSQRATDRLHFGMIGLSGNFRLITV